MSATAQPLPQETKAVAQELFTLLESIDPARWRDELEPSIRARVDALLRRLRALIEEAAASSDPRLVALRERLGEVADLLEEARPAVDSSAARLRTEWEAFRQRLQPAYEELSATLRGLNTVPLPALRPTNYARNLFHIGSGVGCVLLVQHVLSDLGMILVAGAFTVMGWTFEISRRRSEHVNRLLMWVLGPFAHPHERHRINSSTWFTTALFIIALLASKPAVTAALMVLAFGDPFAALVGRRWGRTKLVNRRSLEGSTAFVAVGGVAATAMLRLYYPDLALGIPAGIALAAALLGALAELYSNRVDDNLSIPVAAAAGASLAELFLL